MFEVCDTFWLKHQAGIETAQADCLKNNGHHFQGLATHVNPPVENKISVPNETWNEYVWPAMMPCSVACNTEELYDRKKRDKVRTFYATLSVTDADGAIWRRSYRGDKPEGDWQKVDKKV